MPKLKLFTFAAMITSKYATINKGNVFLNPVVNSNGFLEKGVKMVYLNLLRNFTSAKIIVMSKMNTIGIMSCL